MNDEEYDLKERRQEGVGDKINALLSGSGQNLQALMYAFFLLGGLFWIIRLFLQSDGVINQDEIGHLLIAKNAWYHPSFLLDEWGRFAYTLLYFIPSLFGLTGARIFSIILSFLTIILTTRVARFFGIKYYFLIPLFMWFQPFFGAYAISTMTEIPLSFVLILTVLLTLKNRHGAAAILVGILPLIRHEAVLLTGLWSLYYIYLKKIKYISLAFAPLMFYILLYFLVHQEFVYKIFFEPKPTTYYGTGTWTHYFTKLPDYVGFTLLFLTVVGLFEVPRYGRNAAIFLSGYLLYYLAHIVIWRFALYSSGGYYDVLVPVAPAFAVLAALGMKRIMLMVDKMVASQVVIRTAKTLIHLIILPLVIVHGVTMAAPYAADNEQILMQQVARHIENSRMPVKRVVSTHVWFYYYYFYKRPWTSDNDWISPPPPKDMEPGTIVVWDSHFSERFGLSLDELQKPGNNFEKIMADRAGKVLVFYKH
jgi:hypothetical protein